MTPVPRSSHDIPLAAKIAFTAWMLFWIPVIVSNQGPRNFFWLCNIAQFIVLYAVWSSNLLLLSSQAGTVVLVGVGWSLDLLAALILGNSPTGFTAYMFTDELSFLARATSFYHVGLPPFLLWLVWHQGYDRRGPWLQCLIGACGVILGWWFTEPYRNVNFVYEIFGIEQTPIPSYLWVIVLIITYPLVLYFPGHFLVRGLLAVLPKRR